MKIFLWILSLVFSALVITSTHQYIKVISCPVHMHIEKNPRKVTDQKSMTFPLALCEGMDFCWQKSMCVSSLVLPVCLVYALIVPGSLLFFLITLLYI